MTILLQTMSHSRSPAVPRSGLAIVAAVALIATSATAVAGRLLLPDLGGEIFFRTTPPTVDRPGIQSVRREFGGLMSTLRALPRFGDLAPVIAYDGPPGTSGLPRRLDQINADVNSLSGHAPNEALTHYRAALNLITPIIQTFDSGADLDIFSTKSTLDQAQVEWLKGDDVLDLR